MMLKNFRFDYKLYAYMSLIMKYFWYQVHSYVMFYMLQMSDWTDFENENLYL